jgi:hypothetical protein
MLNAPNTMNRLETEHDILHGAIEAFRAETAMQLEVVEFEARMGDRRIDAILQMPGNGTQLLAEVKKWATHTNLGALINQIQRLAPAHAGLLVADYINPNMASRLREADIQYIDATGNAYLNQPPVYVYIKGNKPGAKAGARTKTGKAFQPAGMKIVYAFLQDRELVNAPYREIAEQAQVALGTVGGVIRDLLEQGILVEDFDGTGRQIADYDQLLDKWVEAYPHKLRDKHRLGTFTTDNPNWWRDIQPNEFQAAWGGEIAAGEYTGYLNAKDAVVYITKPRMTDFLKHARLKKAAPDEKADFKIDLIEPFWKEGAQTVRRELVHPLIVYADLVATGDARNLDTAKRLREKYLR